MSFALISNTIINMDNVFSIELNFDGKIIIKGNCDRMIEIKFDSWSNGNDYFNKIKSELLLTEKSND